MLSLSVWLTMQLLRPKSVSIVLYSMLNQIGLVGCSNCRFNRILGGDRSEKRETLLPVTT